MNKIELDEFLDNLVDLLNKRLKKQDDQIKELRKLINKKSVDKSVKKVLEGK